MSFAGIMLRRPGKWLAFDVAPPMLPSRIPSLDGLRAVSIALVLIGHGSMTQGPWILPEALNHFGNVGVRFFFVLSGFLITTLLLKEHHRTGTISLSGFYVRRSLRIFPAAFAYVGIVYLVSIFGIAKLKNGDLFHALTYTMNYHYLRSWWFDHLWSLSVEEQFYLLWPGLMCLLGLRAALKSAALVVVIAPVIRAVMWYWIGASDTALTKHFEAACDALAIGCLLSANYNWLGQQNWYLRFQRSRIALPVAFCVLAAANLSFSVKPGLFYVLGQTAANFGTVLCLDRCIRFPEYWSVRLLNLRPLAWLGTLSYSLYLWQNAFLNTDLSRWATHQPQNYFFCFCAAGFSFLIIERPFLALKERKSVAHKTGEITLLRQSEAEILTK